MKSSLGLSSSLADAALLHSLLRSLHGHMVLLVGDSTLRNQFVQLARVGLEMPRELPLAMAVTRRNYTGTFASSSPIKQPERPDSSNGYWGGFSWMLATTTADTTLVYAKIWGCSELTSTLQTARKVILRHQRRTGKARWPPDALVWNFGLHLLHMYPARPVPMASLRCALKYEVLVSTSLQQLRLAAPTARLLWRTTNAVCDSSFVRDWAAVSRAYHCDADRSCGTKPAVRVRELCQRRYNTSQGVCNRTVMSWHNTRLQRERSVSVLKAEPQVGVLDAFALTDRQCEATADGRHYPGLLNKVNERLLRELLHPSPGRNPFSAMWLPLCALAAPPGVQRSDVLQPVDRKAVQCSAQTWEVQQYDDHPNSTLPSLSALASRTVASLPNFFTRHAAVRMDPRDESRSVYHAAVPVFLHVNKAGGTSIKQSLLRRHAPAQKPTALENYNMCGTARVHDRLQPGGTDQVHVEGDQFILGDYCMGMCELLAERGQLDRRGCAYFTMLREPKERTISSYLYCQTDEGEGDQLCNSPVLDARNATFGQWVVHQGNYMTRQLLFDIRRDALPREEQWHRLSEISGTDLSKYAGLPAASPPHPALLAIVQPDALLTEARFLELMDALEAHFAVIGVVERYNESLALFDAAFDLQLQHRAASNAWDHGSGHADPESKAGLEYSSKVAQHMRAFDEDPSLLQALEYDLRLYDRVANDIFPRQQAVQLAAVEHAAEDRVGAAVTAAAAPLAHTGVALTTPHIPHLLHHSWREPEPPKELARYVAHWRHAHANWSHLWWMDGDNRRMCSSMSKGRPLRKRPMCTCAQVACMLWHRWEAHFPELLDIYDHYGEDIVDDSPPKQAAHNAAEYNAAVVRADATRLVYMAVYGGVYTDLDEEPCAALDGLLVGHSLLLVRSPRGFLSNYFMASTPGHAYWRFALALLNETRYRPEVLYVAGPMFLEAAFQNWSDACGAGWRGPRPPSVDVDCTGFDTTRVLSFSEFQEVVGAHHWSGMWHCGPNCTDAQRAKHVPGEVRITEGKQLGVLPQRNCLRVRKDGLSLVHIGKSGGEIVGPALLQLVDTGRFERLVHIHGGASSLEPPLAFARTAPCNVEGIEGPAVALRTGSIKRGSVGDDVEGHLGGVALDLRRSDSARRLSSKQLSGLSASIRSYPVLLWVRDPVARVLACWRDALGVPGGDATEHESRARARMVAALGDEIGPAAAAAVDVADVEATLAALRRNSRNASAAMGRLLAAVPQAVSGLAWYVGGVAGLNTTLAPQLMFVGTHETLREDWRRFELLLSSHPARAQEPLQELSIVEDSEMQGGDELSADAIGMLREFYADDLQCLAWLSQNGWLPLGYHAHVSARKSYLLASSKRPHGASTQTTESPYDSGQWHPDDGRWHGDTGQWHPHQGQPPQQPPPQWRPPQASSKGTRAPHSNPAPGKEARGWAAKAAQEIESMFVCNVTSMPTEHGDHYALNHLKSLLLPADTHLFLYGSSHVRSVRSVLVSAARYFKLKVNTTLISRSDNCDDGNETSDERLGLAMEPEIRICGVFGKPCRGVDLTRDEFDGGRMSITTIANHAQYQVPQHADALASLLKSIRPKFTHGYYWPPHYPAFFDAHCRKFRDGVLPDPNVVGDRVESFCDPSSPACVARTPLLATILEHLPHLGVKGGVALMHNRGQGSTGAARIFATYKQLLVPRSDGHGTFHACNVICLDDGQGSTCEPGEGAAVAWEVLRSAGLFGCPKSWPECDPLEPPSRPDMYGVLVHETLDP